MGKKKNSSKELSSVVLFPFLPSILFIIAGPVLPFPSPFQPPPSCSLWGGFGLGVLYKQYSVFIGGRRQLVGLPLLARVGGKGI